MPLQMKLECFLCTANINLVDTDLICLVTAQMCYYSKLQIPLIKNNLVVLSNFYHEYILN